MLSHISDDEVDNDKSLFILIFSLTSSHQNFLKFAIFVFSFFFNLDNQEDTKKEKREKEAEDK